MAPDPPKFIPGLALLVLAAVAAGPPSMSPATPLIGVAAAQDVAPAIGLSTDLGDVSLQAGTPRNFSVAVTNLKDSSLPVRIFIEGPAAALMGPPLEMTLAPGERREVSLALGSVQPKTYRGTLVAEGGSQRREVPFEARVLASFTGPPLLLDAGPGRLRPGETLFINTSPRSAAPLQGRLLVWTEGGAVLFEEPLDFSSPRNLTFSVPGGTPPGVLTVEARVEGTDTAARTVTLLPAPFPTYLLLLPAAAVAGAVLLRWRRDLLALLAGRRRYPPLSAYSALPAGPFAVGRVAGSRRRLGLGPEHLRGHLLVAGATGGGKSVAAMVLAEEALQQKWAVLVCDPTAQWSGLLRPCRDRGLLRRYRLFGLGEPRGWPGARRETPDFEERDLAPGRLLLFDFRENYDENLARLLDRLRAAGTPKAPLMAVFEEIHRALPKYGAPDQLYPLLESVVREFRQRGIVLVMTSQLLSDFSPEIGDNVLAELQMLTKGPEDLARLERKYGDEVARLATRLEPGAGLLHHPEVNGGRPVAVEFRPTLGDPHKIPGPVLDRWRDLWNRYGKLVERLREPDAVQALARARERLENFRLEMAQVFLDEAEGGRKKP